MLERPSKRVSFRFEQMADQINDRVMPDEADANRYVGLEHLDPESLRIRRWGDTSEVESTKLLFRPGDIIFGKRRVYQRKVAVADFEGICSAHAMVLRAKRETILPEFLPFFMQSDLFMERALSISVGSLSPTINWQALAKEEFSLPSIKEQARLVETFTSIEKYGESLRQLAFEAERMFNSLAHNFFSVSANIRVKLSEIVDYASDGPFGSKLKTEHYAEAGARVIRLNNIAPNRFIYDDEAYVPISYFESDVKRYEVKPGDIVIAGLGDEDIPAGRACVVPSNLGPAINKADCFCLRVNDDMDASYLSYFLNSPMGMAQAKAFSQGTTRIRLNLENIKKFTVPATDYSAQVQAAEKLDAAHDAWSETLDRMARLRKFQKALLNSQFIARP